MKNHSFKKNNKNKRIFKNFKMFRKVIAFSLSLGLLSSSIDFFPYSTLPTEVYAQNTDSSTINKEQYVKNGTILHCFSWSFNTIKENLPAIKEAGFTAIQTSPANAIAGKGKNLVLMGSVMEGHNKKDNGDNGAWYWHYQPTDWKIGNWQLGTREEFREMCKVADALGIQVIVDVVPNHTTPLLSEISQDFVDAVGGWEEMYHTNAQVDVTLPLRNNGEAGKIQNFNDRGQCTSQNLLSLPDVHTENPKFQAYFLDYLNDLIACGADGFRYDTGKHIALPDYPKDPKTTAKGYRNNFWDVVTGKEDVTVNGETKTLAQKNNLFIYGEILQDNSVPDSEYTNYVYMTASNYGKTIREKLKLDSGYDNTEFNYTELSNWQHDNPDKIVTWVESHDTFCNEAESAALTNEKIRLGWAAITAREKGTPLFFSRPNGSNGKGNRWGDNILGARGNDEFMSDEVREVNLFRQAMIGQGEYLRNVNGNGNGNSKIYQIDRGDQGTCIINLGNEIEINTKTNMKDGTYIDHVSRRLFTVQNGRISGKLDARKVAVIYESTVDTPYLHANTLTDEAYYFGDNVAVTLSTEHLKDTSYTTSNGDSGSFTDGDSVVISANSSDTTKAWIKLTGKTSNNHTITKEFTFKHMPRYDIYFKRHTSWNDDVKCYIFNSSNNGYTSWEDRPNMENLGFGIYGYKIPHDATNLDGTAKCIFTSTEEVYNHQNNRFDTVNRQNPDSDSDSGGYLWRKDGPSMIFNRFSDNSWAPIPDFISDLKVTSLQANRETVMEGEEVTFTAQVKGGQEPYQYQYKFTIFKNGQEQTLQDFNSSNSVNYTETIPHSAYVKVYVKDHLNRIAEKRFLYTWTPNPANYTRDYDIYFKKPSNWGNGPIHCYVYQPNSGNLLENHAWPGIRMEEHNGIYRYKLPENLANAKIIFNNHESSSPHYQYPNADQPGLNWTKGVSKLLVDRTWTIVAKDTLEIPQLSSNLTSPQIKNTAVTFTATSEKGIGNISYSFFKVNGDVSNTNDEDIVWEQVQNTTANTLTLQPDTEGIITIKVMAEDQAIHAGLRENQKQSTRLVFAWIPDPNISTPSDATPQDNNQNGNTSTPSDATPQDNNQNTPIPPIQQEQDNAQPPIQQEQEQNQNTPTPPIQQEQNTIPSIPERNSSRKISNTRWISYPITSIPRSVKGFTPHRVLAATTSTNKWLRDKHGWTAIDHNGQSPADTWRQYEWNGSKDWYYFDKNGYMLTGWHWINGKCYYLDIRTGKMLFNTTTPDGYTVNQNGEWVKDGMVQKK